MVTKRTSTQLMAIVGLAALAAHGICRYRRYQFAKAHDFRNQVVLITGGSRGLGLEMARLWANEGARLAICARRQDELHRAQRELEAHGCDVLSVTCDVTERAEVESLVRDVIDHWGSIDVLVNNAGIIQAGPLDCMTFQDFEKTMATHFWGPLNLVHACLPHMRAQGRGTIVNIASFGGEISIPHLLPYSASKFALVGLSEGLSSELRSEGIKVTTVCPGLMRTGSPRNAEFKGQHRSEYAWFSISASLPLVSVDSRVAARQIVEAARRGTPFLRISLPAQLAVPLRGLLPGLTAQVLRVVNRFLPSPINGSIEGKRGYESFSSWSPSFLTHLTEVAAARNNEIRA